MKTPATRPTLRQILNAALLGLSAPALLPAASLTWIATESGSWADAANWNPAQTPVAGDNMTINNGGTVTIADGTTAIGRSITLHGTTAAPTSSISITGGSLTLSNDFLVATTGDGGAGVVEQSGGSVSARIITLGGNVATREARYTLSAGTLTATNTMNLGNGGSGYFYQKGGAVSLPSLQIASSVATAFNATTIAIYEIEKGALAIAGNLANGAWDPGSTSRANALATLRIIGSSATIDVGGNYSTGAQDTTLSTAVGDPGLRTSVLDVRIDNGGLSKINLTHAAATASLDGSLAAGIKGGVALTATNTFAILEAGAGKITATGAFTSSLAASALWDAPAIQSAGEGRDALVVSFKAEATRGSLTPARDGGIDGLAFDAAASGVVTLAGLEAGDTVSVYLNAAPGSGKTLGDFVAYFTEGGIVATTTDAAGYNLQLTLAPSATNGYFAWDFSGFNTGATLSAAGFAVATIPEPATFAALFACGTLLFALRQRRRR